MKNKKAILGNVMTTFIATIIIVVILLLFALASGITEKVSHSISAKHAALDKEDKIGLSNVESSLNNFQNLTQVRFLMNKDSKINIIKAVGDVGYGK